MGIFSVFLICGIYHHQLHKTYFKYLEIEQARLHCQRGTAQQPFSTSGPTARSMIRNEESRLHQKSGRFILFAGTAGNSWYSGHSRWVTGPGSSRVQRVQRVHGCSGYSLRYNLRYNSCARPCTRVLACTCGYHARLAAHAQGKPRKL